MGVDRGEGTGSGHALRVKDAIYILNAPPSPALPSPALPPPNPNLHALLWCTLLASNAYPSNSCCDGLFDTLQERWSRQGKRLVPVRDCTRSGFRYLAPRTAPLATTTAIDVYAASCSIKRSTSTNILEVTH